MKTISAAAKYDYGKILIAVLGIAVSYQINTADISYRDGQFNVSPSYAVAGETSEKNTISKKTNLFVYPFQNSGDSRYSWISAGMTDTVVSDLAKVKGISVITKSDREKALEEMKFSNSGLVSNDYVVKLGKMTGANMIFTGSYQVDKSGRVRAIAKMVSVENGATLSTAKVDGNLDDIFGLQDRIVFSALKEANIPFSSEDEKRITEGINPNVLAFEYYSKGLSLANSDPKQSLNLLNKALEKDPRYLNALVQAGFVSGNRLNQFNDAITYMKRADNVFKLRNETGTLEHANFLMGMGLIFSAKGELDAALGSYKKSAEVFKNLDLKDSNDNAVLLLNTGNAYSRKGDINTALRFYQEAQDIKKKHNMENTSGYSHILMNIGVVYEKTGQLDLALQNYKRAREIRNKQGLENTLDTATLNMNTGVVYAKMENYDLALKFYTESKEVRDSLGLSNTGSYASLLMNMGSALLKKGNLETALENYKSSKQIREDLGLKDTVEYGTLCYNMGLLSYKQKNNDAAGEYFRSAYETYDRIGFKGPNKEKALKYAQQLGH